MVPAGCCKAVSEAGQNSHRFADAHVHHAVADNSPETQAVPRSVAQDILWLIDEGKRYGFSAKLHRKLEYIWRASSGELLKQSVLFRFTFLSKR